MLEAGELRPSRRKPAEAPRGLAAGPVIGRVRGPRRTLLRASPAVLLLMSVLLLAAACGGGAENRPGPAPLPAAEADATEQAPTSTEITLLFPGIEDDFLHLETRSVVAVGPAGERARQCLAALIEGPNPGLLAALPGGTQLREVFVLPDGTAWADFTPDLLKMGGSTRELQTIYAIVDTVALNVPEVRRVGILVDGQPRETLAGHVDARRPFLPDYTYIEPGARPDSRGASTAPGPPDESNDEPGPPDDSSRGDPRESEPSGGSREAGETEDGDGSSTKAAPDGQAESRSTALSSGRRGVGTGGSS